MKVSVKLEGAQGFLQKLKTFMPKTNRKVRAEVKDTAERVQSRAKGYVRVKTGRLRNSIRIDYNLLGNSATVGSDVKYAAAQEFGLPGKRYSYTPYLRPAYQAEKDRFLSNLKDIF